MEKHDEDRTALIVLIIGLIFLLLAISSKGGGSHYDGPPSYAIPGGR